MGTLDSLAFVPALLTETVVVLARHKATRVYGTSAWMIVACLELEKITQWLFKTS